MLAAALTTAVRADVSIRQKTSLEVASMIRMHGATVTDLTADKKREDTESHCEGMMSLVCGNLQGGEIVRLDRNVTWHNTDAIPAARFDIPPDWTKEAAKPAKGGDDEFTCPKS
jgi:hypothetical protein